MLSLIFFSLATFSAEVPPDFVDLSLIENVKIDLRYGTKNNFVGENMYGSFNKAYLHPQAAQKFAKAAQNLKAKNPKYKFIVFDALRPRSVQKVLWKKVKGTPYEKYVADPEKGSVHNYGFALDISVLDETGKELDMGTPYDSFLPLAEPKLEDKLLKAGELSTLQLENRKVLRKAMVDAGFIQLEHEWWHYDGLPLKEIKSKFKIVE